MQLQASKGKREKGSSLIFKVESIGSIKSVGGRKGYLERGAQLRRRATGERYAALALAALDVCDAGEHALLAAGGRAVDEVPNVAGGGFFSVFLDLSGKDRTVCCKEASFGTLTCHDSALAIPELRLRCNELPKATVGVGCALKLLHAFPGEHKGGRGVGSG